MEVARSSFYDAESSDPTDDTALVERMHAIQSEFPAYGYRRITAQLQAESVLVNRKRVARLMRLHGMQQPERRPRRGAATRPRQRVPRRTFQAWETLPSCLASSSRPALARMIF
jgi:transposase InsO family protein